MTGLCRDCRWWDMRAESAIPDPDEPGHVPTVDGACRRFGVPLKDTPGGPHSWTYEVPGWETAKAYLHGADVNTVCFMTQAEFGCVQFESSQWCYDPIPEGVLDGVWMARKPEAAE